MKTAISMLLIVPCLLTACSTTVRDNPAPEDITTARLCRPDAAVTLIGHAAPIDAQIRQRTGAELIRRIAPGDSVTHDFRENRVTIAVDPNGTVVQANCG